MSGFATVNFSDTDEGLFSPSEIRRLMRAEYGRALRYGYPASLLLVEVDRLEYLHDLYGWQSKEEILQAVIRLLRSTTRESDLLGCMRDDRVMAFLPHTPEGTVAAIAQRLLTVCRDLDFQTDGRSLRATLSIGAATLRPDRTQDYEAFVQAAEESLLFAVRSGGDRFVRRELAADVIRDLRDDLEDEERRLSEESDAGELDAELSAELAALIASHDAGRSRRALQDEALALVQGALRRAQGRTVSQHRREIETLERRVAKLKGLLDATEAELEAISKMKGLDSGVASIYRTVQGLREDDANFEAKKEMLTLMFEANLDLQGKERRS